MYHVNSHSSLVTIRIMSAISVVDILSSSNFVGIISWPSLIIAQITRIIPPELSKIDHMGVFGDILTPAYPLKNSIYV